MTISDRSPVRATVGMQLGLLVAMLLAAVNSAGADDLPKLAGPVVVHPAALELRHVRQPHSLQVLGTTADGYSVDLRPQAKLRIADPRIASIDERGCVRAVSTGHTTVEVAIGQQHLIVPVDVRIAPAEPPASFRHEVMPVLTKAGCNMGACHGYSLGKNGFKLSLRGADPKFDYRAIARDAYSRRLDFQSPLNSIFLAKPRGDVSHEGGVRFRRDSLLDTILRQWVAQGAPDDTSDKAEVVAIKLLPDKLVLSPKARHQLQLIASYSDGSTRDVTRLGIFSANNTQFANVDDEGLVVAEDAGETAIVARFERTFAATGVIVLPANPGFRPTPLPPQDRLVDRPVIEKLNRLKIAPSPLAGDEEFLRRVYLDLIGVQPKPDEILAFLASKAADKRERVIDSLFDRPEFVDQWSLKWGDLLQNSRNTVSSPSVYLFREFIRGAVASNMPLDEFARRILTSRGGIIDDPASVYFAISKDPFDTVERVTQVFCGVRMLCARCHSHPLENWTQADYYGLASCFNQVTTRADARYAKVAKTQFVKLNLLAGAATNPRTGRPQPPRFLGGKDRPLETGVDRRQAYAQWLTSTDNTFFARGLVNRLWSYFFHRGIVDPVDDVRSTNPAINPALLESLTRDFVDSRFDARQLMRRIVGSDTYQRASAPNESNRHDEQNFSHAIPRRIPAEALLDSLVQATGVPENFIGAPGGFRAAQLPDANVQSAFLSLFGKPQRMEACECERDNGSNMLQALHFINGNTILGRVASPSSRLAGLLSRKLSDEQLVTEVYLWSLARHPTTEEQKLSFSFLKTYGARRSEAAQDMMWALLNSKDFLLVH
ncbi:MAG TPA: DUF1549 and DUF1553 domain-containing protein [Pirellulales bacterium]|jgi:hypothetical protein|nr:DUF1549 and DUF1553 domain-containing protein [Pirellulales bacterium]